MEKRMSFWTRPLMWVSVAALGLAVGCQSEYEKHYDLAKQLRDQELFEEAIKEYKLAAQADPTKARPYYRIGQINKRQGKHLEAAEHFRKALEVEPDYVNAYPELVKALHRADKPDEAERVAKEAMQNPVVKREPDLVREIQNELTEIEKERKAKEGQAAAPSTGPGAPAGPGGGPVPSTTPTSPTAAAPSAAK